MIPSSSEVRAIRERADATFALLGDVQPYTIRRLRELGPGERFVYYRGHFTFDLDRCELRSPYRQLLVSIRETATQLAAQHRIVLSELRSIGAKGEVQYAYVATGI
jgi:hypothetical protein